MGEASCEGRREWERLPVKGGGSGRGFLLGGEGVGEASCEGRREWERFPVSG